MVRVQAKGQAMGKRWASDKVAWNCGSRWMKELLFAAALLSAKPLRTLALTIDSDKINEAVSARCGHSLVGF